MNSGRHPCKCCLLHGRRCCNYVGPQQGIGPAGLANLLHTANEKLQTGTHEMLHN